MSKKEEKDTTKEKREELRKQHSRKQVIDDALHGMNYEQVNEIRKALTGAAGAMKELDRDMEMMMNALALWDYESGMDAKKFRKSIDLDKFMKRMQNEMAVTCAYLYCNWRVWATYDHDEELADAYQDICDEIDGYVFDNWDVKKLEYFVKETD